MASAVDPRYKSLKFLDSSERGAVFRILVEVIGNDSNEQVEDTISTAKRLKTVEEDILDYAASSGSSGSNSPNDSRLSNIIEKEVSLYCSDDEIDHALEWWRLNSHRFPNISQFARHMLCIQATSVPSERLFSAAGNLVTSKRASLHPDNVDKLLFLNKNM